MSPVPAIAQLPISWASNLCGSATNFLYSGANLAPSPRTVIENVHIWDGEQHISNTSVVIEGRSISLTGDATGAKKYDGKGGYLMPGLIDAHVHAWDKRGLTDLVGYGITTAYDMGSWPSSDMPQWHDVGDQGLTSLLFSGAAATAGNGFPAILPRFPKDSSIVLSAENASHFAETRISEGVDYLKIFVDDQLLPEEEFQQIIKDKADAANKQIVTHAPTYAAQAVAREVGGKFITHTPNDHTLTRSDVQQMLDKNQTAIPTLFIAQFLINVGHKAGEDYKYANDSAALMYEMGVPILTGTDAIRIIGPVKFYGSSLHTEFQLLAGAGLKTEDIFKGSTSLAARSFGLTDRGLIRPGMRADLLLLKSDPFQDIKNSDDIKQVWTAGTQVKRGLFGNPDSRCDCEAEL